MHQNKTFLFFLIILILTGCIKQFEPNISSDIASKYVISGRLTNSSGFQYVHITKSNPLNELAFGPVSGCSGSVWDEDGNEFPLQSFANGVYQFYIPESALTIGKAYHIQVFTPEGDELVSEPEVMTDVPEIEIPTFSIDSIYNGIYNYYTQGLQFKINVNGSETDSPFYLFEIDATFEHHARYPREWYYDGRVHQIFPADSSLYYCWTTMRVPEIITLSTENLSQNKFKDLPLHFVPFNKEFLTYGYSLLIRQVGLSREAYRYWENMRLNNNQNAELYSKQPVDTQGNIKNKSHPEREVLGFFSASAISEQRIFIEAWETKAYPNCDPVPLDRLGFREIGREAYPAFLLNNPLGDYFMVWLPEPCVNCSYYSGTTFKPYFWPY